MKIKNPNILAKALHSFFDNYLPNLCGMSPHTILSYRDSLKLFLQFLSQRLQLSTTDLTVDHIQTKEILAFLDFLETDRENCIGTRNIRLSAIHSLFRYLGRGYPEYLDKSQRILNIPFKRSPTRAVGYLEFNEFDVVLKTIDRSNTFGRRDYALLSFMFNTGSRAQEVVDLKVTDLQMTKPYSVRLFGKGRKERICPLWPQTVRVLQEYLKDRNIDFRMPEPVFTNHLKSSLTRFGIRYIMGKYVKLASNDMPSLKKKRLYPHSIRHSTAIHLLKSGVDLATISLWMGHNSINTTNKYAVMDLEMKQKALEKAKPLSFIPLTKGKFNMSADIIQWLESL